MNTFFKFCIGLGVLMYAGSFVYQEYRLTVKHNLDIREDCLDFAMRDDWQQDVLSACWDKWDGKYKLPFRSFDDLFRK